MEVHKRNTSFNNRFHTLLSGLESIICGPGQKEEQIRIGTERRVKEREELEGNEDEEIEEEWRSRKKEENEYKMGKRMLMRGKRK
jgi:hypothetical protein